MQLTVARCSVTYTGRGDTTLSEAVRVIIVKSDGAVSIHHDQGNKPLNYMGKGNVFTEQREDDALYWNFDTRKENLQVRITEILSEVDLPVDVDNSVLERDGTEHQLQAWLADHPEALGEGFTFVQREYPTGAGPVDLLVQDADGNPVAVEVKRVAMLGAVDQASRYIEALKQNTGFEDTTAIVAALDIRPNTQKLADKRGVRTVTLPKYWNKK
jgi:RecB family endonuclease NucS